MKFKEIKTDEEQLDEGILSAIKSFGAKAIATTKKLLEPVNTKKVTPRRTKPIAARKGRKSGFKPLKPSLSAQSKAKIKLPDTATGKQTKPIVPVVGTSIPIPPHIQPPPHGVQGVYFDILNRKFTKQAKVNIANPKLYGDYFGWKFVDLLTKEFEEWDAFKQGLIDRNGNELRKAGSNKDRIVWNYFYKAVANLKRAIEGIVPSAQRLQYIYGRLKYVKESVHPDAKAEETVTIMMEECQNLFLHYVDDLIMKQHEEELDK